MSDAAETPAARVPALMRVRAASRRVAASVQSVVLAPLQSFALKREERSALIVLALLAFVACYLRFMEFGLYEDDLNQARFWSYSISEIMDHVRELFARGGGGRPIGLTFLRAGSWAGYNIGGMHFLYVIGYVVFVFNAYLTFKISKSITPSAIALLAAIMFVLYPADALKFTIVRGLAVQPSLTFGLGAMLLYTRRRYISAYILAALALGVYEFGILPFLTAPFFILEGWRAKLWRVISHSAVSAAVIGAVVLVRLKFATGHLSELTPLSTTALINRFYVALTSGPWTSAKSFFSKPAALFRDFEPWHLIVIFAVLAISYLSLRAFWREPPAADRPAGDNPRSLAGRANWLFGEKNPYLVILVGVAAWIVAYSLAVSASRYPPTVEFGRTTSVHTAATFGASLTFAGLIWLFADGMRRFGIKPKNIIIPVVSIYLAILGGFQAVVQSKCVQSWSLQRHLWRQIATEVRDWRDGTVVIVGYPRAPNTRYVYTMSWATAVTAENMFYFPKDWKQPPTVVFFPQLRYTSETKNGQLWLRRRPWFDKTPVDPEKVIYLSVYPGNTLKREQDFFEFKNVNIKLEPPGPAVELDHKPLYDILMGKQVEQ